MSQCYIIIVPGRVESYHFTTALQDRGTLESPPWLCQPCECIILLVAASGDSHHGFRGGSIDLPTTCFLIKAKVLSSKISFYPLIRSASIFCTVSGFGFQEYIIQWVDIKKNVRSWVCSCWLAGFFFFVFFFSGSLAMNAERFVMLW